MLELILTLQAAQIARIGRRDVDCHITGALRKERIDLAQADQIILQRPLDRSIGIFADVQSEDATARAEEAARADVRNKTRDAFVVETQPIDQRLRTRQAEQPWLRVARLRARSHRADLDKAETEAAESVDVGRVLVEACGESNRVAEAHAEDLDRIIGYRRLQPARETNLMRLGELEQRQVMRVLGIERKKQWAS